MSFLQAACVHVLDDTYIPPERLPGVTREAPSGAAEPPHPPGPPPVAAAALWRAAAAACGGSQKSAPVAPPLPSPSPLLHCLLESPRFGVGN
jgi:hypothetical protein